MRDPAAYLDLVRCSECGETVLEEDCIETRHDTKCRGCAGPQSVAEAIKNAQDNGYSSILTLTPEQLAEELYWMWGEAESYTYAELLEEVRLCLR